MYDGVNAYMEIKDKDTIYIERVNDVGKGFLTGCIITWIICIIWAYVMWREFKKNGYKDN